MILRFLLALLATGTPVVLHAQAPPPQPKPRPAGRPTPNQPRLGLRGYVLFGGTTLTAKDTLQAVADTSSGSTFGGGGQVTNIWRGVFADVAGSQLSLDGERVFIDGGRVFGLGIPLEITMRPLDVVGGWRFSMMRGRIFPYAGAGMTYLQYKETSSFAQSGEDVTESKTGPLMLGGVDVRVWRWVAAGGEIRWRRVRGILGDAGVSAGFDEDDAGGVNAGIRISIGR